MIRKTLASLAAAEGMTEQQAIGKLTATARALGLSTDEAARYIKELPAFLEAARRFLKRGLGLEDASMAAVRELDAPTPVEKLIATDADGRPMEARFCGTSKTLVYRDVETGDMKRAKAEKPVSLVLARAVS
jgi:hypothetical protein